MATLIVGLLVAALVVLAARAVVRQSKTGGCSGCGGGCRGCSGGCHITKPDQPTPKP
nr:FeoB-associated Cys-rich membrane protein [uncultured Agathobaculum sp.]